MSIHNNGMRHAWPDWLLELDHCTIAYSWLALPITFHVKINVNKIKHRFSAKAMHEIVQSLWAGQVERWTLGVMHWWAIIRVFSNMSITIRSALAYMYTFVGLPTTRWQHCYCIRTLSTNVKALVPYKRISQLCMITSKNLGIAHFLN